MIIVSNTSPLNYLILIGQSGILPQLYGSIAVPPAVIAELEAEETPQPVRAWLAGSPNWLRVERLTAAVEPGLNYLGDGERDAILLAQQLRADALLIDDRDGRKEAGQRHIKVVGTLGALADAAELGLVDLTEALGRLQQTTFRASPRLLKTLLDRSRPKPSH